MMLQNDYNGKKTVAGLLKKKYYIMRMDVYVSICSGSVAELPKVVGFIIDSCSLHMAARTISLSLSLSFFQGRTASLKKARNMESLTHCGYFL
jgi:hypothetical protein